MVTDVDDIYGPFGSQQWTTDMSFMELTKGFKKKTIELPLRPPKQPPCVSYPWDDSPQSDAH